MRQYPHAINEGMPVPALFAIRRYKRCGTSSRYMNYSWNKILISLLVIQKLERLGFSAERLCSFDNTKVIKDIIIFM